MPQSAIFLSKEVEFIILQKQQRKEIYGKIDGVIGNGRRVTKYRSCR